MSELCIARCWSEQALRHCVLTSCFRHTLSDVLRQNKCVSRWTRFLCFRAKRFSTSWAWETMGCSPEACWERTRKVRRAILPHSSPHASLPKRENVSLEGNNGEHSRGRNRRNGRRISELWAIKSLFEDQFVFLIKGMSSVIALNIKFSARSHWWSLKVDPQRGIV